MWTRRGFYCLAVCHLVAAQLQPVLPDSDKGNQYILQAINFADRLSVIRHVIIFLGESSGSTSCSSSFDLLPKLLTERLDTPVTMIGKELNSLQGFIARSTVLVIFYSDLNDHIIQVIEKSLYAYYYVSFIFVHKSPLGLPLNDSQRVALFTWCRMESSLRVLLIEADLHGDYQSWVPRRNANSSRAASELKNLENRSIWEFHKRQGFHLNIGVYESLPIVYVYNTTRQRGEIVLRLGGQDGILVTEFVRYLRGSMEIICFRNRSEMQRNIERIARYRAVDIGVNSITNNSLLHFAPAIIHSRICLVLPVARRLPLEKYYYHNIKNSTHCFWIFVVVANVLVKRLSNPRIPWSRLCYGGFKLMFGLFSMGREFYSLRPAAKIIELFTHSFIILINSLIVSALTTSLIMGYYEPDIRNVQDILDSGLRIMVEDEETLRVFERNELPHELLPRVLLVNRTVHQQHFLKLNSSYAYALESYKWPTLQMMQQRLRHPKLRLAPEGSLCTAYRTFVFNMRPELPFADMFQRFVRTSVETGLAGKWVDMGLRQAQQLRMFSPAPYEPILHCRLPMKFFKEVSITYGIGLMISLTAFALEWMHMLRQRRRLQPNELV